MFRFLWCGLLCTRLDIYLNTLLWFLDGGTRVLSLDIFSFATRPDVLILQLYGLFEPLVIYVIFLLSCLCVYYMEMLELVWGSWCRLPFLIAWGDFDVGRVLNGTTSLVSRHMILWAVFEVSAYESPFEVDRGPDGAGPFISDRTKFFEICSCFDAAKHFFSYSTNILRLVWESMMRVPLSRVARDSLRYVRGFYATKLHLSDFMDVFRSVGGWTVRFPSSQVARNSLRYVRKFDAAKPFFLIP